MVNKFLIAYRTQFIYIGIKYNLYSTGTGFYWVFTIIITACYTGSIIAFVTLPVYPETIDSIRQLNSAFYRVGTLDRGGWERW